jgi:phosphoadenosine phosphosulfate reductase
MTDPIHETLEILGAAREKHDAVVVGFSGGKDSLVTLDLCVRTFARVEAFFMYFVEGLECVEEPLAAAEKRWGIKIRRYPGWLPAKLLRQGFYCVIPDEPLPKWELRDIYSLAAKDAGVKIVATGAKRADSIWRRRSLGSWGWDDILYPIIGWNKFDVLAYLAKHKIPLPDSSGRAATGVDLSTQSVLWLHDNYPKDFQKVCEAFPFAEAIVWRRKLFGDIGVIGTASK